MSKFFVEKERIQSGEIIFTGEDAHYMSRVLRLHENDEIEIASDGKNYQGRLKKVTGQEVVVSLIAELNSFAEPPISVTLLQGLPKGDKLELIIQKTVELGVDKIIPIKCSRSVPEWPAKKIETKIERLQKVAESAAAQCGRDRVPTVGTLQNLAEAIASLPEDTLLLIPWEEAEENNLKELLQQEAPQKVAYCIGPEGGFSKEEVQMAVRAGAHVVTLGPRILRTETAAIVTLSLLLYAWGDLGGIKNE